MMLPPKEAGPQVSHMFSRGTCPRCGAADVFHLVIGLLPGPLPPETPDWFVPVGCVHPGYERECRSCGLEWTPTADGRSVHLGGFVDLLRYAGVNTSEEFTEWLRLRLRPDTGIDWDGDTPVLRVGHRGLALEFPTTLVEFWESAAELVDAVEDDGG